MKRFSIFWGCLALFAFVTMSCEKESIDNTSADLTTEVETTNNRAPGGGCATIPGGEIYDSQGNLIMPGFMENGYNYQAHMFNGPYGDYNLIMKWNDAWLSNKDCDGDGLLDRHFGYDSYIGSGAWLTNHWTATYENENGMLCDYDEFIKIVAVPEDATLVDGYWYNAEGTEIGESIWGQFAIIQWVVNDPCEGIEGIQYNSPDHNGFGGW